MEHVMFVFMGDRTFTAFGPRAKLFRQLRSTILNLENSSAIILKLDFTPLIKITYEERLITLDRIFYHIERDFDGCGASLWPENESASLDKEQSRFY